jgi:hypothetical protein
LENLYRPSPNRSDWRPPSCGDLVIGRTQRDRAIAPPLPAAISGEQPVEQGGARVADVQASGRRRREADDRGSVHAASASSCGSRGSGSAGPLSPCGVWKRFTPHPIALRAIDLSRKGRGDGAS